MAGTEASAAQTKGKLTGRLITGPVSTPRARDRARDGWLLSKPGPPRVWSAAIAVSGADESIRNLHVGRTMQPQRALIPNECESHHNSLDESHHNLQDPLCSFRALLLATVLSILLWGLIVALVALALKVL